MKIKRNLRDVYSLHTNAYNNVMLVHFAQRSWIPLSNRCFALLSVWTENERWKCAWKGQKHKKKNGEKRRSSKIKSVDNFKTNPTKLVISWRMLRLISFFISFYFFSLARAYRLANKKTYVFLYGIIGCVFSATYAYFNGTITTLEKRYKIPR